MFFLGGLNTALPYLLYLSLVWAFMIIGITGRHHFSLPHQSHEYNLLSDAKTLSYTGHHADQQQDDLILPLKFEKQLAFSVIKIPDKNPGILTVYLTDLLFRGPPSN
ncbi:MAG TPA: hypothetical protein VK179_09540 [Bacteroidales bacterium]|nr:hypothetical protein [Bacteroidales bacterium]